MANIKSALVFAVILSAVTLSNCSKEEKEDKKNGSASFKVQLKNSSAGLNLSATSLEAKLGGVDLISDCAGEQPPGNCLELGKNPDPDIWINAGCNNDIAQCSSSNTEFFELINPNAANVVLNSQGRTIDAGVFTKVRIYLLNNDDSNSLRCDGVASTAKPMVPIVVNLPAAVTVAEGESVTVTLNYDPSALVCSDHTSISSMFGGMTATVTKI